MGLNGGKRKGKIEEMLKAEEPGPNSIKTGQGVKKNRKNRTGPVHLDRLGSAVNRFHLPPPLLAFASSSSSFASSSSFFPLNPETLANHVPSTHYQNLRILPSPSPFSLCLVTTLSLLQHTKPPTPSSRSHLPAHHLHHPRTPCPETPKPPTPPLLSLSSNSHDNPVSGYHRHRPRNTIDRRLREEQFGYLSKVQRRHWKKSRV